LQRPHSGLRGGELTRAHAHLSSDLSVGAARLAGSGERPAGTPPGSLPNNPGLAQGSGATPRILVVEDDFLVSVDMEEGLKEAGFDVVATANTADDAVDAALREKPDIVVMDVRLLGKRDGVDAALEIFRATGIRCIFATAHHDRETRARAEPSRPLGWLPKPYGQDTLVAAVRRALKQLKES
jgi:CheY-like chemotaxis protein